MTKPDDKTLERMRRAVEALPNLPYRVFRLHRFEELDYSAIAEKLEISVREVERSLAQAIYLIDRHMQREEEVGRRRKR